MSDTPCLFDVTAVNRNRKRAAAMDSDHTFLKAEIADRLADRLQDVNRSFEKVLDIGGDYTRHTGTIADVIDLSEQPLGLADNSYDLIISNSLLHWVDDLPGLLIQLNSALRPDGLMMVAMFGGETLKELRHALIAAEVEITGGAHARVIPFADVRDAGSLLQRAGLALPVADMDTITVNYSSPLKLLTDLRGMGEANALIDRPRTFWRRDVLMRAMELYGEQFAPENGKVPATFQILYLAAWHPHESQQQPLKRGSGQVSLAAALKAGKPPENE